MSKDREWKDNTNQRTESKIIQHCQLYLQLKKLETSLSNPPKQYTNETNQVTKTELKPGQKKNSAKKTNSHIIE